MKNKKVIVLTVCVVILAAVIIASAAACISVFNYIKMNETISFTPKADIKINYNNYSGKNCLDYNDGNFAWLKTGLFSDTLIVVNEDNSVRYIDDIASPFQICGNEIVYAKHGKLFVKDVLSGKTDKISSDADVFKLFDDHVIYSTESVFNDFSGEWENELIFYSLADKSSKTLYENITQFYIAQDKLFVVDNYDKLFQIDINSSSVKEICKFNITQYPYCVMPQGNNVIYSEANDIVFLDIYSGEKNSVSISDSGYVNNFMYYICDEDDVYVSFGATETNGSLVNRIDDPSNGLWHIDANSFKKKKISSTVYDDLYIFDGKLFAVKENTLYQINTADGSEVLLNR